MIHKCQKTMRYLDQKLDIKEKQNMDIKLPQNGPKWALPKKCINYVELENQKSRQADKISMNESKLE